MIQLSQVKFVIAVASGKGGVGKSTLAVNLALSLSLQGKKIGLLDADIYGPSIPKMLGQSEKPTSPSQASAANNKLQPQLRYQLKTNSIGYFLDPEQPAVWRGPMVSKYLEELYQSTDWGELDYLVIDLPPGTGDIQLTLAQKMQLSGVVIITTPQEVALIDAKKAVNMFEKLNVPILGVVENMSGHVCSACGHQEDIFGSNGAKNLCENTQIAFLGRLALDKIIQEDSDRGLPTVLAHPESKAALEYISIAKRVIQKIEYQQKLQSKLPPIHDKKLTI